MKTKLISFILKHGKINGVLKEVKDSDYMVIITNGFNGFYNYGMFPYIQNTLAENGISNISYNFSHGGVIGDADFFLDLNKYRKNCMRLEMLDLIGVTNKIVKMYPRAKLINLAHSMGGVPTIFGTNKLQEKGVEISGVILISTINTLKIWPKNMMNKWVEEGVYYLENNRTKQKLPLGREFLNEVINSDIDWNLIKEISKIKSDVLLLHGEKDETVPPEHSEMLHNARKAVGLKSKLSLIGNAGHTFNTTHPFKDSSIELDKMLSTCINWIKLR